jgi:hypothetical protein
LNSFGIGKDSYADGSASQKFARKLPAKPRGRN